MSEIKAIPTRYNGYHFRSRLEARWAVFLDQLGVEYRYEDEGYLLEDGLKYLPDFKLPAASVGVLAFRDGEEHLTVFEEECSPFLEIKPAMKAPKDDLKRVIAFAKLCGTFVFLSYGEPLDMRIVSVGYTPETQFCVAPAALVGRSKGKAMFAIQGKGCDSDRFLGFVSEFVQSFVPAANAARSARFEHGESGPT